MKKQLKTPLRVSTRLLQNARQKHYRRDAQDVVAHHQHEPDLARK